MTQGLGSNLSPPSQPIPRLAAHSGRMTTPIDEFWPRPAAGETQQTEPILPPEEPPPTGLQPGAEAADVDWQARYEDQQKKTKVYMATTAAAVAALLAALVFTVAQGAIGGASPAVGGPGGPAGGQGQLPGGQGFAPPGPGSHGGGMDHDFDGHFDDDGDFEG